MARDAERDEDTRRVVQAIHELTENLRGIATAFRDKAANPTLAERNPLPALCDDIGALLDTARFNALRLMQANDMVEPCFTLFGRQGIIVPLLLGGMPESSFHRTVIAAGIAHLLWDVPVDAYVFVMEAWMAPYEASGPEADVRTPSQHGERIEVVYIRASTSLASVLHVFGIERDADGVAVALARIDSVATFGVSEESFAASLQRMDDNPLLANLYALVEPQGVSQGSKAIN